MISATTISPLNRRIVDGSAPPFSFGNALQFDGVNDRASSASKVIAGTYSIYFWVNFNQKNKVLFGSSFPYLLYPQTNLWYWQGFDASQNFTYTAPLSTWLAVTISRNASNLCTLFINGVQIDTCTRAGNLTFNNISGYAGLIFDGIIDELYIYDGVEANLADNQAFYNSGNGMDLRTRAGFEAPDRYYSFNEADGSTIVTDAGTDGANLTLTNFSTPPAYLIPHE